MKAPLPDETQKIERGRGGSRIGCSLSYTRTNTSPQAVILNHIYHSARQRKGRLQSDRLDPVVPVAARKPMTQAVARPAIRG
jgi:hypothetical protein